MGGESLCRNWFCGRYAASDRIANGQPAVEPVLCIPDKCDGTGHRGGSKSLGEVSPPRSQVTGIVSRMSSRQQGLHVQTGARKRTVIIGHGGPQCGNIASGLVRVAWG